MSSAPLQSAVQWLHDRIRKAPELRASLFAELRAAQIEKGLVHGTRPVSSYLRPYMLPRSRYDEIKRAAETIAAAMERLAEAALKDEALIVELGLTEVEARLARIDPGYKSLCVTSRLDAFLTETDFQFLEYNAESPAGLADQMLLEEIFFGLPHNKEFLERFAHWRPQPHRQLLRALLAAYHEWGGAKRSPNIAIVDWTGVSTESEFVVLKNYFESENCLTVIADPHELEYDGERLMVDGFAVDILYKRVIIHEFLEKFDETHPLVRAYADHKVCMANSFRAKTVHKKASFAVLSDPLYEHLFNADQLVCIRRHIPWTRRVREQRTTFDQVEQDMVTLLRRNREQFVLKPNDDYGGQGVVIGAETDVHEWEDAIKHALQESYVVQQSVPVQKEMMPTFSTTDQIAWEELLVDFDPFLFLNEVHGGIVRLSSSSLCNVSSGGGVARLY